MSSANPWKEIALGEVIAERALFLDGAESVHVLIGAPQVAYTPHLESACPWRIEGLGSARTRYTCGGDRVQALLLALQRIGSDLYACDEYRSGRLRQFESDDPCGDLGFPIIPGYEDLLPQRNDDSIVTP